MKIRYALGSIVLFASIHCSFPQDWILTSAPITNWASIVMSADGSNLVAAISGGGMFAARDSGLSWVQTTAPSNGWSHIVSSADCVNLAGIVDKFPNPFPIVTSSDSGYTWGQTGASNRYWSAVASSADGAKLVAVSSGSAGLTPIALS